MSRPLICLEFRDAEQALDALLVRVRWYTLRYHRVPAAVAVAFNALADALNMPNRDPWRRIA